MNFILLNPDELRAESIECYGHPLVQTPGMDRLASLGTRFDQCHIQHTVCTPSRCSFMTGLYASTRGHRTLWHSLRPYEPHLFRYLHEAGYDIRWYGKNDMLVHPEVGDCITEARGGGRVFADPLHEPDDPRRYTFLSHPFDGAVEEHGDARCYRMAMDFLQSRPKEPFCVFLPTVLPHPPYGAPEPWHSMYDIRDIPALRPPVDGKPDFHDLIRRYRRLDELDEGVFRQVNAVYLGMTTFVDRLIGELLDTVEAMGYLENTAIILWSDHGDWAGDFGLVEKWPSALDDTLTRVPLIVVAPDGKRGHVSRQPVEAFDVMATVLDLAGIEPRHTHFARSLVPLTRGSPADMTRAVFAEGGYDAFEPHCFEGRSVGDQAGRDSSHVYYPKGRQQQDHPLSVCRTTMIRMRDVKLIYRPNGRSELYDLTTDPRELVNRYDDPALARLRHRLTLDLLDWSITRADTTPFDEDPRGLPRS
ncbi:sulfatase [Candidatus Poribacteria bacterium]|nr:sulfatase [Candidatus Poribacteria bacterium]